MHCILHMSCVCGIYSVYQDDYGTLTDVLQLSGSAEQCTDALISASFPLPNDSYSYAEEPLMFQASGVFRRLDLFLDLPTYLVGVCAYFGSNLEWMFAAARYCCLKLVLVLIGDFSVSKHGSNSTYTWNPSPNLFQPHNSFNNKVVDLYEQRFFIYC